MTADLLTADQVRQILDVDKSTIYRMAADGRLPAVKIGRQWRFPAEQIRRLLATGIPVVPEPTAHANGSTPAWSATGDTPPPAATAPPLPADVVAEVTDLVAASLGVMMVVTDMRGEPIAEVANPCPWFVEHAADDEVVDECIEEWRGMANDLTFEPRFRLGRHGFLCARTFVRSGTELVGMVLVGGVAPDGSPDDDGLFHLDGHERRHVLEVLPRVASSLSRLAGHHAGRDTTREPANAGSRR